ncbi:hypothetical protein AB0D74_08675 [Streptomyces sp. NPDC048278]|uniref:hypothetical protein n=1 Tax=Streptomyces sp. NPDC048278 TaxID=3155809 RepID=UPI003427B3AD
MSEDVSEDISDDEQDHPAARTVSTGTKRKAEDGGDGPASKRPKIKRNSSDEDSGDQGSSSEEDSGDQGSSSEEDSEDQGSSSEEHSSQEYPGQPVGDYVPRDDSSSESQSSQGTRVDLGYHEIFIQTAVAWAEANKGRIGRACQSEGGWESWLEVELYLALQDADIPVSRQPPFTVDTTGGSRADLFLGDRFLVELKVETATESADAFAKRVKTDIDKVDAKAKNRPASVVGFAWSKESTTACTKLIGEPISVGNLWIFQDTTLGS